MTPVLHNVLCIFIQIQVSYELKIIHSVKICNLWVVHTCQYMKLFRYLIHFIRIGTYTVFHILYVHLTFAHGTTANFKTTHPHT